MVCSKREKNIFIFFLPLILNAKELGLGVKREGFEREKHIHTRNLKRWKRGKIELERKIEEKRGRNRSLEKFLRNWVSRAFVSSCGSKIMEEWWRKLIGKEGLQGWL